MRTGYRIEAHSGSAFVTLHGQMTRQHVVGREETDKRGLYLGTTPLFVLDHYTGLSEFEDRLLTYEFDLADVLTGDADEEGEITVSKARLLRIERVTGTTRRQFEAKESAAT
jgi:hypothetical protein